MNCREIETSSTSAGIPVVTEKVPGSRSAGYMIAVATGSRDETGEISGLSHLLEHTVFRATETRDSFMMAKQIEGAGGEINAFTGRECTAFYGITIDETASVAMDIVGDIVANPKLTAEDTELEKQIVLQELSMIKSEPETYIHDLFESQIWRGHPLSRDEGGDEEIVAALTSADLRKYYEEKYRIPNLSVYAVGAVDPEETAEWAGNALDGLAGGRRNIRTEPPRPVSGYRFERNDSDHYQIAIGFPAYGARHRDRTAASMLNALLGSGTSSRLFQEIREKKALVYSVYSTVSQCSDASSLAAYMSCTGSNVCEAVATAESEFRRFLDEGFGEKELERAKNLTKGAVIRSAESAESRLYMLGMCHLLTGSAESLDDRLARIDAVTAEDVMRAAGDILDPGRMNIVILGKGRKKFEEIDPSLFSF